MAKGRRPIRARGGKMHPLFIELYLGEESADSAEERKKERQARSKSNTRRQVIRHS
jgi:hypothetical protein